MPYNRPPGGACPMASKGNRERLSGHLSIAATGHYRQAAIASLRGGHYRQAPLYCLIRAPLYCSQWPLQRGSTVLCNQATSLLQPVRGVARHSTVLFNQAISLLQGGHYRQAVLSGHLSIAASGQQRGCLIRPPFYCSQLEGGHYRQAV
jgi:hypothetical protein